jgi:hypothetical protein
MINITNCLPALIGKHWLWSYQYCIDTFLSDDYQRCQKCHSGENDRLDIDSAANGNVSLGNNEEFVDKEIHEVFQLLDSKYWMDSMILRTTSLFSFKNIII